MDRLKEAVQSLSRQLQTVQAQRECSYSKLIEPTSVPHSQATDFKEADSFNLRSSHRISSCELQKNQLAFLLDIFK